MTVCRPVLDGNGVAYSVQPGTGFCDPGYLAATGSVHTGADWNDTRGGNSDLGAPVFAIADGVVTSAQYHQVWGNIVLIQHASLGIWSQYAHLNEMMVRPGEQVNLGDQIGTIGRGAGNRYIAHLHFEIRHVDLPPGAWPSTSMKNAGQAEAWIRARYFDPVTWLADQSAMRTLAQVQAYRHPIITPAQPSASLTPPKPVFQQLYTFLRNPNGTLRPDAVSITVDSQGRVALGPDNQPRAYYMDADTAAAKGVK